MTQAYLLVWLAAPILSCCWLFAVLVNYFFLVADEGFNPPCVGGFSTACGWSCFSKILGKKCY